MHGAEFTTDGTCATRIQDATRTSESSQVAAMADVHVCYRLDTHAKWEILQISPRELEPILFNDRTYAVGRFGGAQPFQETPFRPVWAAAPPPNPHCLSPNQFRNIPI